MTEEKKQFREIDRREMGRRIKERRETLSITREKMAEYLDVSPQFVADVEYGNKGVSIKSLYILSQALGVTADYILAGSVYELDNESDATRVQEEILELLHRCDAKQLRGIREITEIYIDGFKDE